MERKTKHRVLGIIVIAALVIALLPLLHTSNTDVKRDPQITNMPPFPDQSTQVSDNSNPEFSVALANQASPIPFKNSPENDSGFNQLPDDTINPNTSKAYNNLNKQAPAQAQTQAPNNRVPIPALNEKEDIESSIDEHNSTENIFRNSLETELEAAGKPAAKKALHTTKQRKAVLPKVKQAQQHRKKLDLPIDNNGLFKLKNSAWVIQLGSYKNKTTALRLVNRLRSNGYNAFIQQASSGTSVYVGPESKQEIARSIAARLEYEMKIQGFVISYKPLTL